MADLASLVVRLIADTSRYRSDLDRAANDLNGFQRIAQSAVGKVAIAATAAAAAVGVAMVALAKSAIDAADQMNDLSKATGITTESLSQLKFAAEQSGTDLDGLVTGLRKFTATAVDAAAKAGPARDSFKLIGVSVTDSAGKLKDTETLLLDVAEKFSQYKDGAGKAAAAQDLFGKSGAALIPFLNNGRAGIEALKQEADRLGLTLKGSTAQAADDFNDNLNKLKQQLGGIGLQIAERFLPALVDITKALSDLLAKKSDLTGFFEALSNGMRNAAGLGVKVAEKINNLGNLIGALAAYNKNIITGNFKEAAAIDAEYQRQYLERQQKTNEALARILGERAETERKFLGPRRLGSYLSPAQQEANRSRTGLEKPLKDFPMAKQAVDQLQEVDITLKKLSIPEDFYKDLQDETMTSLERAYAEFRKKAAALEVLKIEAQIDPINYEARRKEIEKGLKEDIERLKEPAKKLNEFQIEAARNTQDIIAGTFESLATGADISFKSILKSFGSMIVRLAAQAAAANIAGKLFGEAGGGTKGTSGAVGSAISALAGFFGGTRDSGGRGRAGMAYAIGTGAQPEIFVPDRSGTFMPAGMGRGSVTNNFTVVADQPLSRRTQLQIAAAAARGVERANRRNN